MKSIITSLLLIVNINVFGQDTTAIISQIKKDYQWITNEVPVQKVLHVSARYWGGGYGDFYDKEFEQTLKRKRPKFKFDTLLYDDKSWKEVLYNNFGQSEHHIYILSDDRNKKNNIFSIVSHEFIDEGLGAVGAKEHHYYFKENQLFFSFETFANHSPQDCAGWTPIDSESVYHSQERLYYNGGNLVKQLFKSGSLTFENSSSHLKVQNRGNFEADLQAALMTWLAKRPSTPIKNPDKVTNIKRLSMLLEIIDETCNSDLQNALTF